MNNDVYKIKRIDVLQKYLLGIDIGRIAGDLQIPKIRIQRELEYELKRNPVYAIRRAKAQARRCRWAAAVLVMEPRERYRAVNEY